MKLRFAPIALAAVLFSGLSPATARITNVAIRAGTGSDSDTLIVGFTIGGTGTKQILLRGIGPTLGLFGLNGFAPDPHLRLFGPQGTELAANDNWGGTTALAVASSAVGAFAIEPDSRDAALFSRIATGSYSAHLTSSGGAGVALVEAYDADTGSTTTRISNLSARSLSGTGADVLTLGFAISATARTTVLIRAVGPSLTAFGVTGAIGNPRLLLYGNSGKVIGDNNDWPTTAGWSSAFAAVGAFPLASGTRDAALLVSLPPGTYTAQAAGLNRETGVALVEVYEVPSPPAAALVLFPFEGVAPASHGSYDDGGPGGVRVNPVVTFQARPDYPFELRRAGLGGEAVIQFLVTQTGTVADAFVVLTDDARFGLAALEAVRRWIFRPGTRNGVAVSTLMQVPIVFTLDE